MIVTVLIILAFLISTLFMFFMCYPQYQNEVIKNIGLFIVVFLFGFISIFYSAIGSWGLEKYEFVGKIDRVEAESFISIKFDREVLYSWYGIDSFQPVIIILTKNNNNLSEKVVLHAFSGNILSDSVDIVSDISFRDFHSQYTTNSILSIPISGYIIN